MSSLCTDGAPSMLGAKSGFTKLATKRAPDIVSTHYILHRHALASKTLAEYLKIVLKKAAECVNFNTAHALNYAFLKSFVLRMGSEHTRRRLRLKASNLGQIQTGLGPRIYPFTTPDCCTA